MTSLGSDKTVGVSGGWLQVFDTLSRVYTNPHTCYYKGGGHGALSNTMGLGVDRAVSNFIILFVMIQLNVVTAGIQSSYTRWTVQNGECLPEPRSILRTARRYAKVL
jgi:hypothetical protein